MPPKVAHKTRCIGSTRAEKWFEVGHRIVNNQIYGFHVAIHNGVVRNVSNSPHWNRNVFLQIKINIFHFNSTSEEDSVQNQDVAYITLSEDNNSSEMIADDDDYEMPTISHVTSIPEMPSTEPHMVSVPMQNFERIAAPKAYTNASASSTPQPAATPNRPNPPSTKSNTNDNQSQTGVAEMDENEIFGELVIREMRKMSCDAKKTFKRNVTQLLYS